jgi:protein ImuB
MRREAGAPRVAALHFPELPLQRLRRAGVVGPGPAAVVEDGRVVCRDAVAAAAGVRAGATVGEARAACGALATFPRDPAAERAALQALAEALLALAPVVELAGADVLLLDASAAHLVAGRDAAEAERVLAERALGVAADMGYRARAVVAAGRGPARALAAWCREAVAVVARGAETAALGRLPLAALGLSPAVVARLGAVGVTSPAALARLPAGTLAHRFGPEGVAAARLARGEDETPLVPFVPQTLPEERIELESPAEAADPLLFALKRLADRVAARLAGRGLGATRLKLTLGLDPRGEERLLVPLAQPTSAAGRWLVPMKEHLLALRLPAAVVSLRLAAIEVAAVEGEQLAFGDRPEALAALEGVLSRLAVRLGEGALFAAEPVARYRPEGAYRAVPFRPAARVTGKSGRGRGDAGGSASPEAGTDAGAETGAPDGAGPPADRPTRLLATPELVIAEGEGGRLTALRVGGQDRAVLDLDGPERLRGEWWASGFDRDYYRVRLEGLGACWVYRDAADGRLYLHGFFD